MRDINRRAFMGLGIGGLAWACARGTGDGAAPTATPAAGTPGALSVVVTTDPNQAAAVGDSRIAFALIRGGEPVAPDGVRVQLAQQGGETVSVQATKEQIRFGLGGEEDHEHEGTEVQEIFVVRREFTDPGLYALAVEAGGEQAQAVFQVVAESETPLVGEQAIAVPSPTFDDPRGVDPICTRDPQCSMHAMTIEQAVTSGRPTVLIFGTPRYCTSRTCGPVVDVIEGASEEFGEQANFIHVEVWQNEEAVNTGPAVEAFSAWKLQTEPYLFFIDASGAVKARWPGAVGRDEAMSATRALVNGEL